jgi:hypothetical protein
MMIRAGGGKYNAYLCCFYNRDCDHGMRDDNQGNNPNRGDKHPWGGGRSPDFLLGKSGAPVSWRPTPSPRR